jgi:uridylate kinase
MPTAKYKRALLKISGEALAGGEESFGLDPAVLRTMAKQIKRAQAIGVEIAVVVGGGNIWRGTEAQAWGMDRSAADYAGMLATVINALALQDVLEKEGVVTRTQSAINIQAVAEPYIRRRAVRHLEKGRVVIFAGGTGNPYMTTDTAAALRAIEIGANVLLMAKNKVDGIYDTDPIKSPKAKKFTHLSHRETLNIRPEVMDTTAFALCLENNLPIIVFNLQEPNSIERVVSGEILGTLVSSNE